MLTQEEQEALSLLDTATPPDEALPVVPPSGEVSEVDWSADPTIMNLRNLFTIEGEGSTFKKKGGRKTFDINAVALELCKLDTKMSVSACILKLQTFLQWLSSKPADGHIVNYGLGKIARKLWKNFIAVKHGERYAIYRRIMNTPGTVYDLVCACQQISTDAHNIYSHLLGVRDNYFGNILKEAFLRNSTEKNLPKPEAAGIDEEEDEWGRKFYTWYMTGEDWVSCTYPAWRYVVHTEPGWPKIDKIEKLSTDPKTPCLRYVDLNTIPTNVSETDIEAWVSFEKQMPELLVPIFRAWIYTLLVPSNRHRQALWLVDSGQSGKSQILIALNSFLGEQITAAPNPEQLESNFIGGTLLNSWLTFFGDVKSPMLLQHGILHSLLGGDTVSAERKYETPVTITGMYSRVIVASNYYPYVERWRPSEMSRVLPIRIEPATSGKHWIRGRMCGNNEYVENLKSQLLRYFSICKKDYDKLCPSNNNIVPTDEQHKLLFQYCSSNEPLFDFVKNIFVITKKEEDYVSISDISEVVLQKFPNEKYYPFDTQRILESEGAHIKMMLDKQGCFQQKVLSFVKKKTTTRSF